MSTGVYEMKALVATIALLCVSSTVLAHEMYTGLRDRDGNLCCGGQDCGPVKAVVLPNGNYTIYQKRVRLFLPAWQRHRLMMPFTVAAITLWLQEGAQYR